MNGVRLDVESPIIQSESEFAESAIDQIGTKLQWKGARVVHERAKVMLQHPEWLHRCAALSLFGQVAEYIPEEIGVEDTFR